MTSSTFELGLKLKVLGSPAKNLHLRYYCYRLILRRNGYVCNLTCIISETILTIDLQTKNENCNASISSI